MGLFRCRRGAAARMLRRAALILPALLLAAAVAAGCSPGDAEPGGADDGTAPPDAAGGEPGPPAEPEGPVAGGTVRVGQLAPPQGVFNPWLTESAPDLEIASLIHGSLLETGPDLALRVDDDGLAAGYEVAPDGLAVTFRLKPDVRWHDGRPFTAGDVAFTFRSIMHPEYPGLHQADYLELRGAADLLAAYAGAGSEALAAWRSWVETSGAVEVVDEHTITFRFAEPSARLLARIGAAPILARHQLEPIAPGDWQHAEAAQRPVGTGPFRLVSWAPGEAVQLARFEDHHGGPPYVERVVFRAVDATGAASALAQGEVDLVGTNLMGLAPDALPSLQSVPGVRVHGYPDQGYHFLFVNLNQPRFQDVRVRRALAHAVDRQELVDRLLGGHGTVVHTPLPPASWAAPRDLDGYPYDPEQARRLLEDAGWTDLDGDGVRERDLDGDGRIETDGCGTPGYADGGAVCETLAVRLLYPQDDRLRAAAALLIQTWLDRVGFAVTLEARDLNTIIQTVILTQPRDYDLGLLAWSLGPDPDQREIWRCGEMYNFVDFCAGNVGEAAARSEQLLEEGARALDPGRRASVYREWARLMHEQLPYVFLFAEQRLVARSDRLRGVPEDAAGPLSDAGAWWLVPDL